MRVVLVSNRLPVSVEKKKTGLIYIPSAGGLVTGIEKYHATTNSLWVGWPGVSSDKLTREEQTKIRKKLRSSHNIPVFLPQKEIESYYNGFCNGALWPLFHYFLQYAKFEKSQWESYVRVNQAFCDTLLKTLSPDDTVWIHDFQLMLLPQMLRERMPKLTIGFFLHVPFPSFDVLRVLPWRRELLRGMLGADLIGFHTYDYVLHFLRSVQQFLGIDHELGQIMVGQRMVKVDAFPLGIDYDRFTQTVRDPAVLKTTTKLRKELGDKKVILSVDRLDYTKGIAERLRAFRDLLKKHPEYRGKVTLILVVVPSRTNVLHYKSMKKEIDELVGNINGAYSSFEGSPVRYLYRSLPFQYLLSLYRLADIALVTPHRDGMNLVAKEFVASRVDGKGVLILSEMAGAAKELNEALIVNPVSNEELVSALRQALQMPEREQIRRNTVMQDSLQRRHAGWWAEYFLERLSEVKQLQSHVQGQLFTQAIRHKMSADFKKASRKLFLLDYDGTLAPIMETPGEAMPNRTILLLLKRLSAIPGAEVVIVSGRRYQDLETWFGSLSIGLIGEHGMWIRRAGEEWQQMEQVGNEWKDQVRPTLERFVDSTPGSFIEEKDTTLAWHYRRVDPALQQARSRELMGILTGLLQNLPFSVREGKKVIEVKSTNIDKGRAAGVWIAEKKWDFIFAAGDDWTDEDLFLALPEDAYSVKVGLMPSRARCHVAGQPEIIDLLRGFLASARTQKAAVRKILPISRRVKTIAGRSKTLKRKK